MQQKAYKVALEWYVDQGVDESLVDCAVDRRVKPQPFALSVLASHSPFVSSPAPPPSPAPPAPPAPSASPHPDLSYVKSNIGGKEGDFSVRDVPHSTYSVSGVADTPEQELPSILGQTEVREQAVRLAKSVNNLDELRQVIAEFDGISIKKTATNLVFADGNPNADVMLIGEAPGADEDRQGKPFVGDSGQLLDRILASIGLSRQAEDVQNAVYVSNILNWRPPGNRTPNPAEVAVSLPFIERHIQLVKPKMLVLCGAVSAKALLGKEQGISRLRKVMHNYLPVSDGLQDSDEGMEDIKAIATYHPAYLLQNPGQKRAVWHDMCTIRQALRNMR